MKTRVINLWGGPGCGKSTTSAELFSLMKWEGYNVELVSEYAKKVTWEGHSNLLQDQLYLLAKQNRNLERLRGQVDYIITDSPLLLGIHYATPDYLPKTFSNLVYELYNSYDNLNFFLSRKKKYNPIGRNQTESEAREIDVALHTLLHNNDIPYYQIEGVKGNSEEILAIIRQEEKFDKNC